MILSAVGIGFPPWYVSPRVGRYGKAYRHIKIRTMLPGPSYGRAYFEEGRLNRLGRLLRQFHLDELTELFHILNGTMSLVGPRPLPGPFLERFDASVRERERPGWTCLAQIILLRRGILLGPEQIRLDNIYVSKKSLGYNVRILAATFFSFRHGRTPISDVRCNAYRRNFI
jgi:lipopolysaccharide/colanic/teichoic acid biosynthesis glycosyltransferase